jgi:hypothetical protein
LTAFARTKFGEIRRVTRDGVKTLLLVCPGCGEVGSLDDDQAHGRVSVDHASEGCPGSYHETHDFWAAAEAAGWEFR